MDFGAGQVPSVPADEAAAAIDGSARDRWPTWERPEWITPAAHAFYAAG
ncbi:hypothetical protein [Streptomyces sp. CMB-StM0423]|nr:hypothetical protein [Streptomyces sp. CMB-StM0423]